MKKLLIVPAILALTVGSAFAQRTVVGIQGTGSPTTANGSAVAAVASPIVGLNGSAQGNGSILTNNNTQVNNNAQGNTGAIGIGGLSGFVSR